MHFTDQGPSGFKTVRRKWLVSGGNHKAMTAEQGVVADGSRLHFSPLKLRSVERGNVTVRTGKRARS
jgi:hypothetical protein